MNHADIKVLGIIAGAGEFPRLVMEGARRAGVEVVCMAIRGAASDELRPLCRSFRRFRAGAVEGPLAYFREEGVQHLVLAGQIKPATLYTMWPDATARRLLGQMDRRNAHSIFGAVCQLAAEHGITVLPSTTFMEECMPPAGHLAGPAPTEEQLKEARFGLAQAREIARLDIGQSIIVHGQQVVCVEAFKGTNECIRSGGYRGHGVTLCKVTKEGHDMRFDVPCLGLGTIRNAIRAGVNHIVFEASRTILFQRDEVVALCNEHGITLHAMEAPQTKDAPEEPAHMADDAAHAAAMAEEIQRLGIGHIAVVCDGVIIAVDDADGPLKCIRRAAAYMQQLRFMRLFNWICNLLMGRKTPPPAPMVLRTAPGYTLPPEAANIARKVGMALE
ncbi:MAG: UDP-2,3-diacylglucosamine diphosphatase LpxI [Akkermansia sp.]|nr:UDP-2,3-diacylglucosamine diphosphatase LpxI [Akkermansia sp.]